MVEEAGETLEPLVLASLPPTAERLIMIGDHQQLRPKVQSYKLQASSLSRRVTASLPSMLRLMCCCRIVHLSTHIHMYEHAFASSPFIHLRLRTKRTKACTEARSDDGAQSAVLHAPEEY
jgi:hypothetical protein